MRRAPMVRGLLHAARKRGEYLAGGGTPVLSSPMEAAGDDVKELLLDYRLTRAHGNVMSSGVAGMVAGFLSDCCEDADCACLMPAEARAALAVPPAAGPGMGLGLAAALDMPGGVAALLAEALGMGHFGGGYDDGEFYDSDDSDDYYGHHYVHHHYGYSDDSDDDLGHYGGPHGPNCTCLW